jgi:hypothetical protein
MRSSPSLPPPPNHRLTSLQFFDGVVREGIDSSELFYLQALVNRLLQAVQHNEQFRCFPPPPSPSSSFLSILPRASVLQSHRCLANVSGRRLLGRPRCQEEAPSNSKVTIPLPIHALTLFHQRNCRPPPILLIPVSRGGEPAGLHLLLQLESLGCAERPSHD